MVLPAAHRIELLGRIEEQLGRYGVAGRVELDGELLRLSGHGQDIAVLIDGIDGWRELDEAGQIRLVERAVRELVSRRHAGKSNVRRGSEQLEWLRLGAAVAVVGAGIVAAWHWLGRPAQQAAVRQISVAGASLSQAELPGSVVTKVGSPGSQPNAPSADSCQRVQRRIATGGSVSVLDVDGWVVELMLLSDKPDLDTRSAALDAFLSKDDVSGSARRLSWTEDEELSALGRQGNLVVLSQEQLADVLPGVASGLRIAWTDKYVAKYFDEATRSKLQRLAAAMYEVTGAAQGALYARCLSGGPFQIGSWFRGRELAGAALAIVAAMGLHAEVVHLEQADPRTSPKGEQRRVWERLAHRARRFDRSSLSLLLAEDGGMVASRPGTWTTITFPFQDANRATRASLRITTALGFAPKR